jgi:quinol monooxygenase YgiN
MFTLGYYITAELRVKHPSNVEEAKFALLELCAKTLNEPGCTIFQLHQDEKTPTRFLLWERFDDEIAFKKHFEESHTKSYVARDLTEVVQYFQSNTVPLAPNIASNPDNFAAG